MIYRTYFKLDYPVINIDDANKYLQSDNMTEYLKNDNRIVNSTKDKIISIKWIMRDDQSGYIELETNEFMLDIELSVISSWVSGQNSDGLGEGFSQQSFANYRLEENDWSYDDDDEYYEDEYVMASFDWKYNAYKFELITEGV